MLHWPFGCRGCRVHGRADGDVRSDQAARRGAAPNDPWADEVRDQALLALLGGGHAMIPLFETLDRYGLIAHRDSRSGTPCGASHSATPSIGTPLIAICSKPWRRPPGSHATSCGPTCFSWSAFLHEHREGLPGDHTDAGVYHRDAPFSLASGSHRTTSPSSSTLIRRAPSACAKVATSRDLSDPASDGARWRARSAPQR